MRVSYSRTSSGGDFRTVTICEAVDTACSSQIGDSDSAGKRAMDLAEANTKMLGKLIEALAESGRLHHDDVESILNDVGRGWYKVAE